MPKGPLPGCGAGEVRGGGGHRRTVEKKVRPSRWAVPLLLLIHKAAHFHKQTASEGYPFTQTKKQLSEIPKGIANRDPDKGLKATRGKAITGTDPKAPSPRFFAHGDDLSPRI